MYRKRILVRRSTNENELFFSSPINHNVYPIEYHMFSSFINIFILLQFFSGFSRPQISLKQFEIKIGSDSRCSRSYSYYLWFRFYFYSLFGTAYNLLILCTTYLFHSFRFRFIVILFRSYKYRYRIGMYVCILNTKKKVKVKA